MSFIRNSFMNASQRISISISDRSKLDELEGLKKEIEIEDHKLPLEEFYAKYQTDPKVGLTSRMAAHLLIENGPNSLVTTKPQSKLVVFLKIMFGGFAALLWVGAILSITGYYVSYLNDPQVPYDQLYLGSVLVAVVIITSVFTYCQESANTEIIESFSKMIPKFTTVVRDDSIHKVPVQDIVLGDLIELEAGDCVPADLRVITSHGLKVDNSPITGECEYQPRSAKFTDLNPLETENLVFFGTNVVEGNAEGIVIGCGKNTLIGHIAGLTTALVPEEMPIKKELNSFIVLITILATLTGFIFFIISLMIGYGFFEAVVFFIAIIIANVPEGMLVTLTACLTLTAKKMSSKNCLVKNLQAIETLGSTDVICSDKTGTLTQNRMTVSHMYYDGSIVDILFNTQDLSKTLGFGLLCRVGTLCMRAEFKGAQENVPTHQLQVIGDASETAVLKAMEMLIGRTAKYRADWPKVCEIPFTSEKKYQLSIHHRYQEAGYLLVLKGAPEIILEHCSFYYSNGTNVPLITDKKKEILKAISQLGYMGERVMGFADFELPINKYPENYMFNATELNFPLVGLRFVGLMSMIDPPRPNVPEAVHKCKSAGIRIIMVTGDHPITAVAIARKVGIISTKSETIYDICMLRNISLTKISEADRKACTACVVSGGDLREMSQEQLDEVLTTYQEIVFARTSPQQKLKIVESLQRLGSIVAVTGDGVNDSPALKKADIGVAMGISGSDVSKDAADMIILDDNFASIVTGVEEGRLVFDNLKKSIAYVLTSNIPEVIPFISFVILNTPQMLSILTIILIDVGTDLWPAISLAYEKPEADIMIRNPRDPRVDKLVTSRLMCLTYLQIGIIQTCASFSTWFFTMSLHGFFYDRLIGIRDEWDSPDINNLVDSYGNEWTYTERKVLERKGYSAYFLALVITQIADVIIAKTRKLSVLEQGMTNWVLNFGIMFVITVAFFTIYTPGLNRALNFEPIELFCILPAVPFACLIIICDEFRKYLVRRYPKGWVARETYY